MHQKLNDIERTLVEIDNLILDQLQRNAYFTANSPEIRDTVARVLPPIDHKLELLVEAIRGLMVKVEEGREQV